MTAHITAAAAPTLAADASTHERRPVILPLNRLFLSAQNVRKKRDPATIPGLAAMIEAHGGLLYPLVVIVERTAIDGVEVEGWGVVAGGRRLAALQLLARNGRISAEAGIECLLAEQARAAGVSLTENASQEPMHPADQLEAFKALVDEGKSAGQIAAAFGVSSLTVERRLKLANLAPIFIDLYRAGHIEVQQLQALALCDDHAKQVQVWQALPSYSRSAHYIRSALVADEVPASSALARFVSVDAYTVAGGAVRTDLFGDDDTAGFLQDGDLLARLAMAALEGRAEALRAAGWKWVEARMSFGHADRSRFAILQPTRGTPTATEAAAMDAVCTDLAALRKRLDELEAIQYDDDGDGRELTSTEEAEEQALQDQCEALDELHGAMVDALREWSPEQQAMAGAVVYVGDNGALATACGLVRSEDRKELAAAAQAQGTAGGPSFQSAPKERAEFSATLCANMTAHRTAAVAAALTQNPKTALAALLHTLIVAEREPWHASPLGVRFDDNAGRIANSAEEFDSAPAANTLAQAEAWADHLPGDSALLFAALQATDLPELLDLLARCVARSYSVIAQEPKRSGRGFDPASGIEAALQVDMADWWTPTPARYLNHVSKAKMIEAVTEAKSTEAARPIEKMKKPEAIAAAAALLEGSGWLPRTLRPYVGSSAE